MGFLLTAMVVIGAVGLTSTAPANSRCSTDMYKRADASLVRAATEWSLLLSHQRAFGSCDDGALAEGYSDAVVSLLAHHWDQFDALVGLSARNPAFSQWVIRHIDATADSEDLRKVLRNTASCTGSAKRLCRALTRGAQNALTEQREP